MNYIGDSEKEAMIRRAFVDGRADYVEVDSRRQWRALQSSNYGMDKGWLYAQELDDGQCTAVRYRLTPEGRKHFGLAADGGSGNG